MLSYLKAAEIGVVELEERGEIFNLAFRREVDITLPSAGAIRRGWCPSRVVRHGCQAPIYSVDIPEAAK